MIRKALSILSCGILAVASASAANYLSRDKWQWDASSICSPDGNDIAGLEGICDGDPSTCWHSNYHAQNGTPERSNPHWVMIDRGTDTKAAYGLSYLPRQAVLNTHCTYYMVYLSNKDLGDTPADSQASIIAALGQPDYQGSWDANDVSEKFIVFDKPTTARYILFVNVSTKQSSSAACAEMNLLSDGNIDPTPNPDPNPNPNPNPGTGYNAVKITPADGSAPHRIAIDGTNLTITRTGNALHLTNSGITVEYLPEEVAHFAFERYEFAKDEYYSGTKKDIFDAEPFNLAVTPAAGELSAITEIIITAARGGVPAVNDANNESVKLHRGTVARRNISPSKMKTYLTDAGYVISGLNETTEGDYTLNIPEGFFLDSDGARSAECNVTWTVKENSGTSIVDVEVPTITLARDGGNLIAGGLGKTAVATLVNTAGITVASAPVNGHGVAVFSVGSLPAGVYVLTTSHTSIKIVL